MVHAVEHGLGVSLGGLMRYMLRKELSYLCSQQCNSVHVINEHLKALVVMGLDQGSSVIL